MQPQTADMEIASLPIDTDLPVLVVDDYVQILRIICNLMRELGFSNLDTAANGAEALKKLRKGQYSLVLSDWNMEPITGYQLLQEIRQDAKLHDTPFIMITAESKSEYVMAAREAGVDNYIVKPFTSQTLFEKIEQVFRKA